MPELLLRSYHEVRGALFRPEAGWEVPSSYGALDSEVLAVRRDVGMIDFSDRAKIRITGADRVTFLDGLVTADVKILAPGTSAYALVLNERSRVLGDLRVIALDDAFVLDIEAAQRESLLGYFRKMIVSDDVTLDELDWCGHIEVHGPSAPRVVANALGVDVRGLPPDAFVPFAADRHHTGYAVRMRTTGESGYALLAPEMSLEPLWAILDRANVRPIGREAFDLLRIEAGVPRFGVDMSEETLALEVAPEGAISFTKGCYTGQEVVARGTYVGHMNRRLLGLRVDGDVPPAHGDRVTLDANEVGFITSGAWSPTKGWMIALALLRVDLVRNASALFIDHDGWDLRARLHPLPFVAGSA
jgi:folate-binding protein YgfZ